MAGIFDLTGRHVLVTGASSGLGRHFAGTLAAAGAKVSLAARREGALADTLGQVRAHGGDGHSVVMDVTDAPPASSGRSMPPRRGSARSRCS